MLSNLACHHQYTLSNFSETQVKPKLRRYSVELCIKGFNILTTTKKHTNNRKLRGMMGKVSFKMSMLNSVKVLEQLLLAQSWKR